MDPYEKIFAEYVSAVKAARQRTELWWNQLYAEAIQAGDTPERAEQKIRPRWPMGPGSHPFMIAVFRKYYLEIEKLNEVITDKWLKGGKENNKSAGEEEDWGVEDQVTDEETVSPPLEIVGGELHLHDPNLGTFIQPLAFVPPIGFEEDDEPEWEEGEVSIPFVNGLTKYSVDKGIKRLLSAPQDLPEIWVRPAKPLKKGQAASAHRGLFSRYEKDLKSAVAEAVSVWAFEIRSEQESNGLTQEQAVDSVYNRALAGPATSRYIVWVVRKYWLACEATNQKLPEEQWIPPEVFVLGWLVDGKHEAEVQVLSQLPFWPLGLTEDGKWI